MQSEPTPKRGLFLLSPAYRRWITPDVSELRFEMSGLTRRDLATAQLRVFLRDLDSNKETKEIVPLDDDVRGFTLPVPKLHSSAELIVFVEDRRTNEPMVEGRWRLTGMSAAQLAGASYFDNRNVCFQDGRGSFPILWNPDSTEITETILKGAKKRGFDGVVLSRRGAPTDRIAALGAIAEKLQMALLVDPSPEASDSDALRQRVRHLRAAGGILAFLLSPELLKDQRRALEFYRAIRATDPSRPVVWDVGAAKPGSVPKEFQDAIVIGEAAAGWDEIARRNGFPAFGALAIGAGGTLRRGFYERLSHSAAGVVVSGPPAAIDEPELGRLLAEASNVRRLIIRGTPDPLPQDDNLPVRIWRRNFAAEHLIVVVNPDAGEYKGAIPVPPSGGGHWLVLRERRTVPVDRGGAFIKDVVPPRGAIAYTNSSDLAKAVDGTP